jgi:hypothetical protein
MKKNYYKALLHILCMFAAHQINAQLIISQYYEGASNNKFIELTNMGTTTLTGTYYLCLFSNPTADPVGVAPTQNLLLPSSIAPCELLLYKNSGAAAPTYALGATSSVAVGFSGNDIVIISTTNNATAWANRTDVVGTTGTWGMDISYVRTNDIPNTTYTPADWVTATLTDVANASSTTNPYLGHHDCTAPTPLLSVSENNYSAMENGGAFTFDVTISASADCSVDLVQTSGNATSGSDFSYSPSTINFVQGGATSQTVTVTYLDDAEGENTENLILSLQNASGTSGCTIGNSDEVLMTIFDNDADEPQILIDPCESGQALLDYLVLNYKATNTLGYDYARDTLYKNIDNVGAQLSCAYSGYTITLDPATDPSIDAFAKGINAEHAYPQSKGASNEPQRSDMHILYPAKDNVNSARSNCEYAEVDDASTTAWYRNAEVLTTVPSSHIEEYSEKGSTCAFEPRENMKGDVARSVFYFYTMYKAAADAADPTFFNNMKDVLLTWHEQDPVDKREMSRTVKIAPYQEDKVNPFVLDSTLVRRAYFEPNQSGSTPSAITTTVQAYTADRQCTDGTGWTHYWKMAASTPVTPQDVLLLSIYKGNSGVVVNPSQVKVEVLSGTSAIDLTSAPYVTSNEWFVMRRYWDVSPSVQPSTSVPVRFYYTTTEFDELAAATSSVTTHSDMYVYKVGNGKDPNPMLHNLVTSADYSQPTWTYGAFGSYHYAEFSVNSFSGGGLGGGTPEGALPIEMAWFTANAKGETVELKWKTLAEQHTLGFDVERSEDGASHFEKVGFVAAKGPSIYQFSDANVKEGTTYYYRLKQCDKDGQCLFTNIKPVKLEAKNKLFALMPVPTDKLLRIQLLQPNTKGGTIEMLNMLGQVVHNQKIEQGTSELSLDVAHLNVGHYIVRLTLDDAEEAIRFVKN